MSDCSFYNAFLNITKVMNLKRWVVRKGSYCSTMYSQRQTDRQTDRQTETDRQRHRERDRERDRETETEKETEREFF